MMRSPFFVHAFSFYRCDVALSVSCSPTCRRTDCDLCSASVAASSRFSLPRCWRTSDKPCVCLKQKTINKQTNKIKQLSVTFNDLSFRVGLAGFDEISAPAGVELETVLLLPVCALPHRNILQGDDPTRFFVGRKFEIVKAVVVQDEPAPFPALVPAALLPQPALLVRIEEGVHEVIAVILWDLKRFRLDALIQTNKQLPRQILPLIYTAIHVYELLDGRLLFHTGIVQARVQHNYSEGEDVTRVRIREYIVLALAVAIAFRKTFHHPVDLLRLARQPKAPQKLPAKNYHGNTTNENT